MLLFDENISIRVPEILQEVFPGAKHVKDFSLIESPDSDVWDRAKEEGLAIISKDDDFIQRSLVFGHPPKVILLSVGNSSTRDLITFLKSRALTIHSFIDESEESLLVLKQ